MIDHISIAYISISAISLGLLFLRNKSKLFLSNNFLICLITILILAAELTELVFKSNSGFLYESIQFEKRMLGNWFYPKIFLVVLAVLLPILNIKEKYRHSLKLQCIIFAIYFGIVVVNYFGNRIHSVVPGWHTTIETEPNLTNHLTLIILGLILNLIIVNFKLLPEFKR